MAERFRDIVQKLKEHGGSHFRINISEHRSCFSINPDPQKGKPFFVVKAYPEIEITSDERTKPLLEEISKMLNTYRIDHSLTQVSSGIPIDVQDETEMLETSHQLSLKVTGKISKTIKNTREDEEDNRLIRELIKEIEGWILDSHD